MTRIAEFFGISTKAALTPSDWHDLVEQKICPFLNRTCIKTRKSLPSVSIGTCTMFYGAQTSAPLMICPHRLLERHQVFMDCIHLLTLHEPGNELRLIPETSIPGGNIDYFLVSIRSGKIVDFVGIELQTLDTTGTVWPERQQFLQSQGIPVEDEIDLKKRFGMNWKMTAKTVLVQLHHKVATFEHLNKHLVLVVQDHLLDYMKRQFQFAHIGQPLTHNPMHFHSYSLVQDSDFELRLQMHERLSTDTNGIAQALGLQVEARVQLNTIIGGLEAKLPTSTVLSV
jgi:hypothetical protein